MPTYDYECLKCKKSYEIFHRISDESLKYCPECGGKLKRLISTGVGLIFKGTGFFITDYKKKSETEKADKKGKGEKKEGTQKNSDSCSGSSST